MRKTILVALLAISPAIALAQTNKKNEDYTVQHNKKQMVDKLFNAIDKDKDGYISKQETEDYAKSVWSKYDKNNTGKISKEDFEQYINDSVRRYR